MAQCSSIECDNIVAFVYRASKNRNALRVTVGEVRKCEGVVMCHDAR